jgi:N6-adenosine-specific RNA methylase IME4
MLPAGVCFWRQPYAHGKIHSAKPEAFIDLVEQVSPPPRLELFARRNRLGWDTWGNEALCHVALTP